MDIGNPSQSVERNMLCRKNSPQNGAESIGKALKKRQSMAIMMMEVISPRYHMMERIGLKQIRVTLVSAAADFVGLG